MTYDQFCQSLGKWMMWGLTLPLRLAGAVVLIVAACIVFPIEAVRGWINLCDQIWLLCLTTKQIKALQELQPEADEAGDHT